jgi:hypothetical protein
MGLTALSAALAAAPAAAQTLAPRQEAAVTAGLVGPVSFGTRNAELTQPSGAPLVIFRTANRLAPGMALEAHLGARLTPRLMVEASGGWHRADFETRITDDIEDAEGLTLTQRSSRFTVEGALLWTLVERGRVEVFARGGGGWLRELAGGGVVVEDGAVGTVGAGVKYWWRDSPGSRIARVGLRVEGRASLRSTAITLGDRSWRVAPVVVGGIVFGF